MDAGKFEGLDEKLYFVLVLRGTYTTAQGYYWGREDEGGLAIPDFGPFATLDAAIADARVAR